MTAAVTLDAEIKETAEIDARGHLMIEIDAEIPVQDLAHPNVVTETTAEPTTDGETTVATVIAVVTLATIATTIVSKETIVVGVIPNLNLRREAGEVALLVVVPSAA